MQKIGLTGIILAGGKSRRMGQEKGLIELNGKFLIQYAIDVLQPICDTILISTNSHSYDFLPYQKVADEFPNSGPMGGIYSCLKASTTIQNLVLSCDMPFIQSELLSDLIKNAEGYDVVVPWHGGQKFEPMCAYYHKNVELVFFDFIQRQNFKIPDTFGYFRTNKFQINNKSTYYSKKLFFNLNSKEELEFFKKKIGQDHA